MGNRADHRREVERDLDNLSHSVAASVGYSLLSFFFSKFPY